MHFAQLDPYNDGAASGNPGKQISDRREGRKVQGVSTVRITDPAFEDRTAGPILGSIASPLPKEAHEMGRMTHTRSLLVAVAIAAAALAATGSGSAATAKTVNGTVGPGFTITLTMQGKNVTKLKVGKAYRFVISDRSSIHDFHLSGPGVNRVFTSVEFTGTKSFVRTLKKGSYSFVCDPHSAIMHGRFLVS
jgi:plastocyanin